MESNRLEDEKHLPATKYLPEMSSPKPVLRSHLESRLDARRKCKNSSSPRVRSVSAGRSRDDLRARYWAFLFDNLHRAVDEIYQNCETDESVLECKEAIMILDNYTREFHALIQWLNLNKHLESTPTLQRPTSLAWEVRKSIPAGERLFWNTFFSRNENKPKKDLTVKNSDNCDKSDVNFNEVNKVVENEKAESAPESFVMPNEEVSQVDDVNNNKQVGNVGDGESEKSSETLNLDKKLKVESPALTSINQSDQNKKKSASTTTTTTTLYSKAASIVVNGLKFVSVPVNNSTAKQKKLDQKPAITISKNYVKDTSSSRAKTVKNMKNINANLAGTRILSSQNLSIKPDKNHYSVKENLNSVKTKKIKDADGWELVRGRQRFKNSPTKVVIIDDQDQIIKTTSDGTVVAVTASSQTTSAWPDWEQIDPRMCATWPGPSHLTESESSIRTPGRALKMHEKLSSPSRKRSLSESIKKHEEKLAKAQEAREKLLCEKAGKFKGIVKKVEEMKVRKEEQQMLLKISMERKLQRAEEKRLQQLKKIIKKAHDEESKVIEIQFINSLEAQNKRHDILIKERDHEARLADLIEERQRRSEEKTAKEAAAEERRKALEEERNQRMIEIQERRKQKESKIEQQQQEKEKERLELAKEKARDRQERISARNAAFQANVKVLQKKILLKQEESKRRHEENMEQIRQKAFELSVKRSSAIGNDDDTPSGAPYATSKLCVLCQVSIWSEVFLYGHLRGMRHQDAIKNLVGGRMPTSEELEQFNLKYIVESSSGVQQDGSNKITNINDCENERLKASKKRCKKLKQRLLTKGTLFVQEFKSDTPSFGKCSVFQRILKLTKELNIYSNDDKITGPWPNNMVHSVERIINELEKILKNNKEAQLTFNCDSINGLFSLCKFLSRIMQSSRERPTSLPDRVNAKLCSLILTACYQNQENNLYLVQSNCIVTILEVFSHRCNLLDTTLRIDSSTSTTTQTDSVIASLCRLLAGVFNCLDDDSKDFQDSLTSRLQDIISLMVSSALVDKLSCLLSNIRGPIDQTLDLAFFLESILIWINSMIQVATFFSDNDPTQLLMALNVTHLAGVVSLIYGVLLHAGTFQRDDEETANNSTKPHELMSTTLSVVLEAVKLCNNIAIVNLQMIQNILGGDGLSLQLRHICSYLLWYCSKQQSPIAQQLLHEVILLIGNFVVLNRDNQAVIQLGQRPTILQQLCSLPFEYFSDAKLMQILFPTLIATCFLNDDNKKVLEQEISTMMLINFIETTIVQMQLKAVNTKSMMTTSRKSLINERWSLASRFPKNKWNQAKDYFESCKY